MFRFRYYPPILGYHKIGTFKRDHVPTVSPEAFERQLAYLSRRKFQVVGVEEIVESLQRGTPWPRRAVAITFDDGYEETSTIAWPILKRFGFPATVFITTKDVGLPGFMTWDQVQELARDGMTIGSHTLHHSYLPLISTDRLPEELVESKRVIEAQLSRPVQFISYPIGGFTEDAQRIVEAAGYRAAFTTNRASFQNGVDRFALRRVKITERDRSPWLFWAKLSGYYDAFRQLKPPG